MSTREEEIALEDAQEEFHDDMQNAMHYAKGNLLEGFEDDTLFACIGFFGKEVLRRQEEAEKRGIAKSLLEVMQATGLVKFKDQESEPILPSEPQLATHHE